jgi:hypothetical protein
MPYQHRLTAPFKYRDDNGDTVWRIEYLEGWAHFATREQARKEAQKTKLTPRVNPSTITAAS